MNNRVIVWPLLVLVVALALYLFMPKSNINWECYSAEVFQVAIESNKPVVLYFTSQDCRACQINEKMFAESTKLPEVFDEKEVIAIYADISIPHNYLMLQEFGYDAVPVLIFFNNGSFNGDELSGEITEKEILDFL